jgi:hypothetical protein
MTTTIRFIFAIIGMVIFLLCFTSPGLASDPIRQTRPLKIENTEDEVKLTIQSKAAPTNPVVEVFSGSQRTLALEATASGSRTNLGIQAGTVITSSDGTVTNAFGRVFNTPPIVVNAQLGLNTTPTNVLSVTTSNFVLRTALAGQTNTWQAIGPPSL